MHASNTWQNFYTRWWFEPKKKECIIRFAAIFVSCVLNHLWFLKWIHHSRPLVLLNICISTNDISDGNHFINWGILNKYFSMFMVALQKFKWRRCARSHADIYLPSMIKWNGTRFPLCQFCQNTKMITIPISSSNEFHKLHSNSSNCAKIGTNHVNDWSTNEYL